MRIVRILNRDLVREVCIKYHLYTQGDCQAYNSMPEAVDDMPGYVDDVDAIIINTAIDIEEHSTDEHPPYQHCISPGNGSSSDGR